MQQYQNTDKTFNTYVNKVALNWIDVLKRAVADWLERQTGNAEHPGSIPPSSNFIFFVFLFLFLFCFISYYDMFQAIG